MLVATGYALVIKPHSFLEEPRWPTYHNEEFGISFRYPPSFHIYQPDDKYLRVSTGYKDPKGSAMEITLDIRHYSPRRLTPADLGIAGRPYTLASRDGYDTIHIIEDGSWVVYILSDRGTFSFSDTLDAPPWQQTFKASGVYEHYRSVFEDIIGTFRFQ